MPGTFTTGYQYDSNGNLLQKNQYGVVTNYSYFNYLVQYQQELKILVLMQYTNISFDAVYHFIAPNSSLRQSLEIP
jgi:hypothetical protein